MDHDEASKVVRDCAEIREAARENYTIPEAIGDARWVRRTPDGVLSPERARQVITTLLSAIEANPCYLKAALLCLPSFTILPYDRAGHIAIREWANAALAHGCRPEKVSDARFKVVEWEQRFECKWPD